MTSAAVAPDRQAVLRRRIRLLVAATITYNVVEAIVALAAGTIASSVALIGFGLDSVIEVSSAAAVAWQFAGSDPRATRAGGAAGHRLVVLRPGRLRDRRSCARAVGRRRGGHSTVGIVLVAISVVVMPFLSFAQRRAGRELGSASAVADSKQTLLCTYLSAAVLVGLVLNAALGWWWADPVAAPGVGRARCQGRAQRLARGTVLRTIGDIASRGDRCGLRRRLLFILTAPSYVRHGREHRTGTAPGKGKPLKHPSGARTRPRRLNAVSGRCLVLVDQAAGNGPSPDPAADLLGRARKPPGRPGPWRAQLQPPPAAWRRAGPRAASR